MTAKIFAAISLFAMIAATVWAIETPSAPSSSGDTRRDPNDFRMPIWDSDPIPQYFLEINPHNILASMNSWTVPVLDHTGKPHKHGHVVQIIMDGINGLQDPPNPDGSPGGDDSLAYGNMNLIRVLGVETETEGASGLFYSQRFFIPFYGDRAYYLRIWEGDDVATAPYYQDTIEYNAGQDRGGKMIVLRSGLPIDVDWSFGPSKPRPKPSDPPANKPGRS